MVKEGKSFYDGDDYYWSKRLGKGYGKIKPSTACSKSKTVEVPGVMG